MFMPAFRATAVFIAIAASVSLSLLHPSLCAQQSSPGQAPHRIHLRSRLLLRHHMLHPARQFASLCLVVNIFALAAHES